MVGAASTPDLVIHGGRLIDPRNGIDAVRDIAIRDGRIAAVEDRLDRDAARETLDASGLLVVPGLIDLHTHVYHKATTYGVDPDPICRRSATVTMVDAGSAGAGNFAGLRDFVFAQSPFRMLAYLNISYPGIFAFEGTWVVGEATVADLLSVDHCVAVADANRDVVVGVKVRLGANTSGDIGLLALDRAIAAAEQLGLPVMAHVGKPPPAYAEILAGLRPGDILTHCYRPAPNAPVDESGNVLPALLAARERGVLFDIAHGMGAFGFVSAEAAVAQGFLPDIISSDVHAYCVNGPAFDLLHTMSKLINCGIAPVDVVAMATDAPARALHRDDLGHLSVGAPADVSILGLTEAQIPLVDVIGDKRQSRTLLQPRAMLVGGRQIAVEDRPWEQSAI